MIADSKMSQSIIENSHVKCIKELQISEKEWCIEAMVIRVGIVEQYSTKNGSGKLQKLILVDNEVSIY